MTPQPDPPPASGASRDPLERVLTLVRFLRVHCPWDARQTARSLVPHLLEEAHEVAEAVRLGAGADALAAELGDLLLNVAYQVVVAEEPGTLDVDAVVRSLERKMVVRHPHVDWSLYPLDHLRDAAGAASGGAARDEPPGTSGATSAEASSSAAWERRKAAERGTASVLEGVGATLDPLARAHRIQERAAAVGFDWDDLDGPAEKVREELDEARAALGRRDGGEGTEEEVEDELGDLLFAAVNLCRRAGLHPANALAAANAKFARRFRAVERRLAERGAAAAELSLVELDAIWDDVKAEERQAGGEP